MSIHDQARESSFAVCFTGHRPEKIPFDASKLLYLDMLSSVLYMHAYEAAKEGYDTFYCGMQRGVDIWAGKQVLRLKTSFPQVKLICVSPFEQEIESRHGADLFDYEELKQSCDEFIALHREYVPQCYMDRNKYMVDRSSYIIGAIADRKSGTSKTLLYAKRKGLRVREIDLIKFAEQYDLH